MQNLSNMLSRLIYQARCKPGTLSGDFKMKNTHTPGPWSIRPSSNPKNGFGWRDIVSEGAEFKPSYVGEAMEADAYLIATAPDLLECLEGLHKALARMIYKHDPDSKEAEWLQHSNEAIRKAHGL